jgi:DNA-directed RNA polymerase subunit M/transcription elongation factor TFIIS
MDYPRNNIVETFEQFVSLKKANKLENIIYKYSFDVEHYIHLSKFIIGFIQEKSCKEIALDIINNKTHFNNSYFDAERDTLLKEILKIKTPIEIVEGIFQCPKCSSKKTNHYSVQLRRSDEPPTIFISCMEKTCKFKWRKN